MDLRHRGGWRFTLLVLAAGAVLRLWTIHAHPQVQGARFWARNVDPPGAAPDAPPAPPPRFDLRDVMGDDFPQLAANLRENLVEGRARVIQLVARAAAAPV